MHSRIIPAAPPEATLFNKLPDELLLEILSLATSRTDREDTDFTTALAISRTCKRFYQGVLPFLYRTINDYRFLNGMIPPSASATLLHRTMMERPALRPLVKRFMIQVDRYKLRGGAVGSLDFMLANKLVVWLGAVKHLCIFGGFENIYTWPLAVRAVEHMPQLNELTLYHKSIIGAPLAEITRLSLPGPCKLKISSPQRGSHDDVLPPVCHRCLTHAHAYLIKEKRQSGTIVSLDISVFRSGVDVLRDFLSWPRSLETFSFKEVHSSPPVPPSIWDFEAWTSILAPQRTSLKAITLGRLPLTGEGVIETQSFPNLERLQLSFDNLTWSPKVAASKLLAPHLEVIGFDFDDFNQQSLTCDVFGKTQADWVREFAESAISTESSLRQIRIIFNPENDAFELGERHRGMRYPWDWMDEIQDVIGPKGITLSYKKPMISKREFEDRLGRL
jgi:F-box-like